MKRKFYKIINSSGYVLTTHYEPSAEKVLGYGGVWGKDHRKAKRFYSMKDVRKEIDRIPYSAKYLIVTSDENWKKIYAERKDELL